MENIDEEWGMTRSELAIDAFPDEFWREAYDFALREIEGRAGAIVAPERIGMPRVYEYNDEWGVDDIGVVILHKDYVRSVRKSLIRAYGDFRIVFENAVFYVLSRFSEGRELNVDLKDDVKRVGFVHIPKTAGTSVFHILRQFANGAAYFGTRKEFFKCTDFEEYSVVGGHCWFSDIQNVRNRSEDFIFSILREPAERFISAVAHARRENENVAHFGPSMALMRRASLMDYIVSEFSEREIHIQSNYLGKIPGVRQSREEIFYNAKGNVSSGKLKVFHSKNMGDLEGYLSDIFKEKITLDKRNVTSDKEKYFNDDELRFVNSSEFISLFKREADFVNEICS
jgi:hypothetical protein